VITIFCVLILFDNWHKNAIIYLFLSKGVQKYGREGIYTREVEV
jgi:hypothetical protein